MKFYILKHPTKGYLCGNKEHKYFSENIEHARIFKKRNGASNCISQSWKGFGIKECRIVQFDVLLYVTDDTETPFNVINSYENLKIEPEYFGINKNV